MSNFSRLMKYDFVIGIDPGVETGIAIWDFENKALKTVCSLAIHDAIELVQIYNENHKVKVRFEDARLRKWFGNAGREQLQGAGSIKRDCSIWEGYLQHLDIAFDMVAPKNNKTKLNSATFKKLTKWDKQTNEHSRDAAMLVFGL